MSRGRPKYPSVVCILAPHDCPNDPAFEHDHYFGCVPKDFSTTTGRSRKYRQRRVMTVDGEKWLWNGGCDAARVDGQEEPRP